MSKKRQFLIVFVCAVLSFALAACGNEEPMQTDPDVAAVYQDHEVLWEHVEMSRKTYAFAFGENGEDRSDLEIVNDIIEGVILKEEAMKRGLMPSESEVEDYVASVKDIYAIPEGKEMMDDYLDAAEMTIDEYYEILRDAAPAIIAKQNLRDEIGREYCQEHGIEFTKVNPPEGMMEAVDAYIEALFLENQDEIEYFFDVNQ